MSSSVLLVEPIEAIDAGQAEAWTLNRPSVRNALDPEVVVSLVEALEVAVAGDVRAVVLRGAGESFCAGADLRFLATHVASRGETPRKILSDIWDLTLRMERSRIIFLAALHGHAVAGGLELALACDVVIAEEGTLIGDGHVGKNLLPGGGASARMERALGKSTALWLGLSGALLDARDPGLAAWLREVVSKGDGGRRAMEIARKLVAIPGGASGRYKRILHEAAGLPAESDKIRELDAFDQHWIDQDVSETLGLFLSKSRRAAS